MNIDKVKTDTTAPTTLFSFLAEAPWASSRKTTENAFWQRILAKSGVFCHRWDNHSHIDKNVREE